MSVSMPAMPIPARVLELEARFGNPNVALGGLADSFLFGQALEGASAGSDIGSSATLSAQTATKITPAFHGSVVNEDGTLADDVPYAELFRSAGVAHGIQPSLLAAVAKVESAFNPNAVSSAGATGLMQFMPATASGMGVDPADPASAIDGAARYLSQNLRRFGSLDLALAAYNAGPGAVERHGGIPPFAETQAYVPKVLAAAGIATPTEGIHE